MSTHDKPQMFTEDQVRAAFNSAAEDVLDRLGAGDDGARDLVNLAVNAGLYYLANPNDPSVDAAILANYDPEGDEEVVERVLGWAAGCV